MDVSQVSIMENSNSSMKLSEEKMIACASNCEDHTFVTVAKTSEENLVMACASNCEDRAFDMEVDNDQDMVSKGCNEDVEVDIVENVNPDKDMVGERESLDATENSSSFGCTDSGTGTAGAASDVEVESQERDDNVSLIEVDRFSDLFATRKKKVTSHWRKFIRPLMWRCRWVELQIRELHSRASKYDRELADYGPKKHHELHKCADGNLAMKTVPLVYQKQSGKVMKRSKRKRVEETKDLAAYSSCHSLFSYFANKRASGDSAYVEYDHRNTEKTSGEFGVNDECSFLELKDCDAFEDILRKIEVAQIRARQLKARVDKVVRETAERYTPVNSCLAQCEPSASGGPSSFLANVNGENNIPMKSLPTTSQQKNLVLPVSEVLGYREVKPLPDATGTTDQSGKSDETENRNLVNNLSVKEEVSNTAAVEIRITEEPQSGIEVKTEVADHAPDSNSPSKMPVSRDQLAVKRSKLNTTVKNKRKRGRRKARWSKRSSG